MLFNSYSFIIFMLVVLLACRWSGSWQVRRIFLLIGSYLFYAAWNPPFVLLLIISTLVDWFVAGGITRSGNKNVRKLLLSLSMLVNLGMLFYFKYGNFILDNFTVLVNSFGFVWQPAAMNIILPVGISFYTFQTMSYTIDVYAGKTKQWHSFIDYALYVTFFPQLVAGPIVRATDFLPQCTSHKNAGSDQLGWGLILLVVGLFSKMVLADIFFSPVCDKVFNEISKPGQLEAWAGVLAFAGQIFCDFSGYSTCAIGVALCLGFALPDNFRFPYAAVGFSDFWNRWHISLSTWLRDYLYISLGGNRRGSCRTYVNLMLTMLLGGLWHGASWLFVVWGGLHGCFLIAERLVKQFKWSDNPVWRKIPVQFALALLTFICVCFAWVFFRATDMEMALTQVVAMAGGNGLGPMPGGSGIIVYFLMFCILLVHWLARNSSLEEIASKTPFVMKCLVLVFMIFAILISAGGTGRAFIYFQF